MRKREVRIGLAVIFVLLVVLGVVVVRRLSGSREEPQVASLESKSDELEKVPEHPGRKEADPLSHAKKFTLLAPKGPSSPSPKTSPGGAGQWSVVSDEDAAKKGAGSRISKASPPSYMPNPPQAQAAEMHERYGSAYSPPSAGQTWSDDRGGASSLIEVSPSRDPLHHHAGQNPAESREQGGPSPHRPRLPDGPAETPPGSGDGGRGSAGSDARGPSGEYGARGANRQQPPGYGQGSPYGFSTLPQSPEPGRPYGATEQRAGADAHYGAGGAGSSYGSSRSGTPYVAARGGSRPGGANAGPAWGGRELRREDGTYEIQPNDSFWTISEKLYGTGAFFKALAEHNRKKISQEDRLPVGEVIAAPDVAQLEKAYPELCPKPAHRETDKQRTAGVGTLGQYATGRSYVVQEGDTLFDIARNELGKASRWAEIYELNRDQLGSDYNYLPRGLQLVLPPNDSTGGTTHRPGTNPLYRR